MNSYKRLDNLCRDTNGIGITGYIEDMDKEIKGSRYVAGWKDDYNQLKEYRHIRNKIAHENYVDEEDLCSKEDEFWLEDFYQRIIEQTDPLALCYKAAKSFAAEAKIKPTSHNTNTNADVDKNTDIDTGQASQKASGYGVVIFLIAVIVMVIVYNLFAK